MAAEKRQFRALRVWMRSRPKRLGPWMEVISRRVGVPYYYNRRTEVSTWLKPAEWEAYDRQLNVQIAMALELDSGNQMMPSTTLQAN